MPWRWRQSKAEPTVPKASVEAAPLAPAPPATDPAPLVSPPVVNPPAAFRVRFRIDRVFSIMGKACMVAGTVEEGAVRPSTQLRVEPGPDSPTVASVVDVVEVATNQKTLPEAAQGSTPGLTLRGVPGTPVAPGSVMVRWNLRKGDYLVSL